MSSANVRGYADLRSLHTRTKIGNGYRYGHSTPFVASLENNPSLSTPAPISTLGAILSSTAKRLAQCRDPCYLCNVRNRCYNQCMPRPLQSTQRAEVERAQYERAIAAKREARRELKRTMRDITHSVQHSPAMPGDTTHNGADARKSRKRTDTLARHEASTAYVVSDTYVYHDDVLHAIERSPSRLIVRNADGTIDSQATLALVTRWNKHRASESRKDRHNA